jgi:solute carrier family 25 iron transporter 28/37
MKLLYSKEGFVNLWSGSRAVVIGWIPAHAAYFSIYEYSKKKFDIEHNSSYYFLSTMATGAFASFFHDFFMTPMEVIKQRIQLTRTPSVMQVTQMIIKDEGIIALYRSLPVMYLMNIPYAGIFITAQENLRSVMLGPGDHTLPQIFACAAAAGCIASILTTPLDVIKTKLNT